MTAASPGAGSAAPGAAAPGAELDTVTRAAGDPDAVQPYAELGLRSEEYARIRDVLGRRPTACELAMYSVMWSEHCSYKSSKVHLRTFADLPRSDALLAGIGENAGVVAVSDHLAVTFKVESHNHPSYVEPYQGAATGVGGIIRDILAMGARPVAVMDSLRFGDPLDADAAVAADVRRLVSGVVAGVAGYGNCIGLPNIGGETAFDASYAGNPLVNALCVGVLPRSRLQTARASGVGNRVVLFGAKTGRDGIGGVSVLASATFDDTGGPAKRPSVQVGDPFTEKVVTECCLELYDQELVVGIQDLGGAGFTCAISETAANAGMGMRVHLDAVPLREASMAPEEVLVSESQERMLAIVAPDQVPAVLAVCRRWGVLATEVGVVDDSGRLTVSWHGETVVDVPPGSLVDDGPVYDRPLARPAFYDDLAADDPAALPRPASPAELAADLLALLGRPNLADPGWVTQQYDSYVRGNTVLGPGEDAGVLRLEDPARAPGDEGHLGVAISLDGPGRAAFLDPYRGAQLALAEAARNVAVTGAVPLGVTNCLNFGSPEDPGVMWQFAEAVRGLADGCRALGLPVTGGNVSFYNSTGDTAIHPTPVVGVLGVLDDVERRTPTGFTDDGDTLLLVGDPVTAADASAALAGSAWACELRGHLGGRPAAPDFARERQLGQILLAGSRDGMLSSAHDLSAGGLAVAAVECCLRGGLGARLVLPAGADAFLTLFGELPGRVLVSVPRGEELRFTEMCQVRRVPVTRVGTVDAAGGALEIQDVATLPLDQLRTVRAATWPALFG